MSEGKTSDLEFKKVVVGGVSYQDHGVETEMVTCLVYPRDPEEEVYGSWSGVEKVRSGTHDL